MKIDSKLILKEGAILKAEKIDFSSPEVKSLIAVSKAENAELKKIRCVRIENFNGALRFRKIN
jgi:hypothetical protein